MDVPAWRILEEAVLEKHILAIPDADEHRTEVCLDAVPFLFCSQTLRNIECIADNRTPV